MQPQHHFFLSNSIPKTLIKKKIINKKNKKKKHLGVHNLEFWTHTKEKGYTHCTKRPLFAEA